MLSTIIFLVWTLAIAATAGAAKLNNLSVLPWTLAAVIAGPMVFVPLYFWIEHKKGEL